MGPSAGRRICTPGQNAFYGCRPFLKRPRGGPRFLPDALSPFLTRCLPVDIGQPGHGEDDICGRGTERALYTRTTSREKAGEAASSAYRLFGRAVFRDEFAFGPVLLISFEAAREAVGKRGLVRGSRFAGLYDLRLKVSIDREIAHVRSHFTRSARACRQRPEGFSTTRPRNRAFRRNRRGFHRLPARNRRPSASSALVQP